MTTPIPATPTDAAEAFAALARVRECLRISEIEGQQANARTAELILQERAEESAAQDRREEQAEWHATAATEARLIHLASALANLTLQPRSRAVRIQIDALAGAILTTNA